MHKQNFLKANEEKKTKNNFVIRNIRIVNRCRLKKSEYCFDRNLTVLVMFVSLWSAVYTRRFESKKKGRKKIRYNTRSKYLRHFDSERPIFQCRTNLATKGKKGKKK